MLPDVTLTELEAQMTPKPSVGLRACIVWGVYAHASERACVCVWCFMYAYTPDLQGRGNLNLSFVHEHSMESLEREMC